MKIEYYSKAMAMLLMMFLVLPLQLFAQTNAETKTDPPRTYSQEELDKFLAPIALYPDALLSQILMASTYPLEIVEADRWLKKNPELAGNALDAALQEKSWDVSVKSLCHFPRVLDVMSDNLELTNNLGNAFLGQEDQVMDTIQKLRAKARDAGNLSSTEKYQVNAQEGAITIEPTTPDVIYVPSYDPCWVYGPWWYPTCAPVWFWYPGIVVGAGFYFGPGIFIGPVGPWCGFHWHQHEVFVHIHKTYGFHRPSITRMHGGTERWVHNPVHRRGITYRSPDVAHRFGQTPRPGVEARRSFRGFGPDERRPGAGIGQQIRPEPGRPTTAPRHISPGTKTFGEPGRSEPSRPEMQPRSGAPGSTGTTSAEPRRGNAFESFGSGRGEVGQHRNRGFDSMEGNRGDGGRGFQSGGSQDGGRGFQRGGDRGGSHGGGGGSRGGGQKR